MNSQFPSAEDYSVQTARFAGLTYQSRAPGRDGSPATQQAFKNIGRTLDELKSDGLTAGPSTLSISAAASFAAMWLAPRIHLFQALHPAIELRLAADNAVPTTSASMLHCATVQALTAKHWRRRGSGLRVKCFSCVRRHWPPAEISVTRKHLYIMRCCGRCLRLGQTSPDGPTGWPGLLQRA